MLIDSIPTYTDTSKIELHLHLEGAIPLDALWTLCEKYDGDPEVPDITVLKQRFAYKDFPRYNA